MKTRSPTNKSHLLNISSKFTGTGGSKRKKKN